MLWQSGFGIWIELKWVLEQSWMNMDLSIFHTLFCKICNTVFCQSMMLQYMTIWILMDLRKINGIRYEYCSM